MGSLRDAYKYMEKMGMCKGSPYGPNGEVCAVGACISADVEYKDINLLDIVAAEQFPDRAVSGAQRAAAAVNDHPETTLDDMRVIFEKAALVADETYNY